TALLLSILYAFGGKVSTLKHWKVRMACNISSFRFHCQKSIHTGCVSRRPRDPTQGLYGISQKDAASFIPSPSPTIIFGISGSARSGLIRKESTSPGLSPSPVRSTSVWPVPVLSRMGTRLPFPDRQYEIGRAHV